MLGGMPGDMPGGFPGGPGGVPHLETPDLEVLPLKKSINFVFWESAELRFFVFIWEAICLRKSMLNCTRLLK